MSEKKYYHEKIILQQELTSIIEINTWLEKFDYVCVEFLELIRIVIKEGVQRFENF